MRGSILLATALAALSVSASAQAAEAPPSVPSGGWACDARHAAWREADLKIVKKAIAADVGARIAMLPELEAVLARAPEAPWPQYELCGDTMVAHVDDSMVGALTGALMLAGMKKSGPVVVQPMPYGLAALLVGSVRNEKGQPDLALSALDKGARLAPDDWRLAKERAFTLSRLHRNDEAVAVADHALAADPTLDPRLLAGLHRARGYALGELGRYDEAIDAYKQSKALDPGDRASANEITYLEGRRGGKGPSQTIMVTSDKVMGPPAATVKPPA